MEIAADTAAVMVTHDGERFLRQQCESIFGGSLLPAVLVVVDDASGDSTPALLREIARTAPIPVELIWADSSALSNYKTRIAANFGKALRAAAGHEFLVLSDQDDVWLPDRLARQRLALRDNSHALLVAGDAILINAAGLEIAGLLSDSFPVPPNWHATDPAGRTRSALRMPLVTGAAATMTAGLVELMLPVPPGWLHDRWATLVAVARDGLLLQREPVIKYRLHAGQILGSRQAGIGSGERRWRQIRARGAGPIEAAARASAVVRRLRPIAIDADVRRELSWRGLISSAMDRR